MFGSGFQSPYIRPWTLSESPLFLLLVCLPACLLVLGIPLRPLWKLNPFFYFSKYYTSSSGPPGPSEAYPSISVWTAVVVVEVYIIIIIIIITSLT